MSETTFRAFNTAFSEAEQFYTHIRQLKHEMRGHLTNIKGLARSGEYASLEDYIARMDGAMRSFELTLQTGNPVTDVIVNDTRRRSLDLGVRFQEDAPMHGLGLQNVRREAEKYMGELELNTNQQEFSATVLLQERSDLS